MIKIWGRNSSSNVQKVLWLCDELGLPYERVDIGGPFGGTDSTAYRALNPNGLIPTIEDGDFVLWESNPILRYLHDKYGEDRFMSASLESRADADRWMTWENTVLARTVFPVFFQMVRTAPEQRDQEKLAQDMAVAGRSFALLEAHLADRPYLTGEAFSLADLANGIWCYRWHAMEIDRPDLPNVAAWYRRMTERPAYQTHVMVEMA
ncbi:MAG: glutathione S-transferase family protein [Pseudomonadota bacterium]